jgi:hypothetical protein
VRLLSQWPDLLLHLLNQRIITIQPGKVQYYLSGDLLIYLHTFRPTPERPGGKVKVGIPEVGIPEVGTVEVGTVEVGMLEVGTPEVGIPEVGTVEVGTVEVGML